MQMAHLFRTFLAACALCHLAGCGERNLYSVRGQIVDKAGNPIGELKGSSVQFENLENKSSAHGVVDDKGEFRLSTNAPGDGAWPGKCRVAILRVERGPDIKVPHVIDPKYENFETSGLVETIEKRDNSLKLQVERYKK
jgi:hypothetical protein